MIIKEKNNCLAYNKNPSMNANDLYDIQNASNTLFVSFQVLMAAMHI